MIKPRMFSRAIGISDHDLCAFDIEVDLVGIRSGQTSYGTIVFGKLRLPSIQDQLGSGFIHVRLALDLLIDNYDLIGGRVPPQPGFPLFFL